MSRTAFMRTEKVRIFSKECGHHSMNRGINKSYPSFMQNVSNFAMHFRRESFAKFLYGSQFSGEKNDLTSTKFVHRCVSLTKLNKGKQS